MQQWRDESLILTQVKHGEQAAIVHVLTRLNGRTAGYVRRANATAMRPIIQAGNLVAATWQSRLADQLGYLTLEPMQPLATQLMQRPDLSLVLQAVTHMLLFALPEKQPYPMIFEGTKTLLQTLPHSEDWAKAYVWWEVHVLSALGFGLRLDKCVQTEEKGDLTHVSPKSGHAVSRFMAQPYADRLLKLPAFLGGAEDFGANEVAVGLALTGYFIQQHIAYPQNKPLPEARQRLMGWVMRGIAGNGEQDLNAKENLRRA